MTAVRGSSPRPNASGFPPAAVFLEPLRAGLLIPDAPLSDAGKGPFFEPPS